MVTNDVPTIIEDLARAWPVWQDETEAELKRLGKELELAEPVLAEARGLLSLEAGSPAMAQAVRTLITRTHTYCVELARMDEDSPIGDVAVEPAGALKAAQDRIAELEAIVADQRAASQRVTALCEAARVFALTDQGSDAEQKALALLGREAYGWYRSERAVIARKEWMANMSLECES